MTHESLLLVLLPVLLVVLLVFEKRRQRTRVAFIPHRDRLEAENRYRELEAEMDNELGEQVKIEQESPGEGFRAFLRGRPTRRMTAAGIVTILHGLVGIGGIAFVLFMVFRSALVSPVVRIILLCTVGAAGGILLISALVKRAKREKELLHPNERR
jgi:Flp pilus assembly protein TadB